MPALGAFLFSLAVGLPIAFALIFLTIVLIATQSDPVLFRAFHQQLFGGLESYGLLALPLFMLVGEIMGESGIARRLIAFAGLLVGRIRGGLAYVNLLANAMMASILGSAIAQISMMNRIMTPEMIKAGFDRRFATSLSTGAGLLAPVLPPSMIFVIYGVLAQVSIGDLFLAGVGPGLLMLSGFVIIVLVWGRRGAFPAVENSNDEKGGVLEAGFFKVALAAAPGALVPLIIFVSIVGGIATPTEAAAMAVLASVLIGSLLYRELDLQGIWACCIRAAITSGVILTLIAAAQLFGFVIVYEEIPAVLTSWISDHSRSPLIFLLFVNLLLILIGMFLDGIAALIIVVPLLLPVATQQFGIDPYLFGVVICMNLAIGLVTPPIGAGLYVASATTGEPAGRIAIGVLPFILVTMLTIAVIVIFPQLTTFLM